MGERYANITKEVIEYLKGAYGRSPAPINQDLYKKDNGDEEPITCRPQIYLNRNWKMLDVKQKKKALQIQKKMY